MSQQKAKFTVTNFRGGVNSDVSPMQSSHEQARTIDNFVIGNDGSLQRRLGLHSVAQFDLPKLAMSEDINLGLHSNILRGSNIRSILWRSFGLGDQKIVALNIGGGVVGFYSFDELLNFSERAKLVVEDAVAFPVPVMTAFKKTMSGAIAPVYEESAGGVLVIDVTGSFVNHLRMRETYESVTGTAPTSATQVVFNISGNVGAVGVNPGPAVQTQNWPEGAALRLNLTGNIWGAPGIPKGSELIAAEAPLPVSIIQTPNNSGGDAIRVDHPLTIDNQGTIASGGGPGGCVFYAASGWFGSNPETDFISAGVSVAGGRGAGPMSSNVFNEVIEESLSDEILTNNSSVHAFHENTNLFALTGFNSSTGLDGRTFTQHWVYGLAQAQDLEVGMMGGKGGDFGEDGEDGEFDSSVYNKSTLGEIDDTWWEQPGGSAGIAIDGTSNVTFVSSGNIIGPTAT